MRGKNGPVLPNLSLDDIERLLGEGAHRLVDIGDAGSAQLPHSHLDHALQTAAVLRDQFPEDEALAVAGLVHDIGHLLPGVTDAQHARAGAAAVRAALGERVAALVGLHVAAKRYLVALDPGYGGVLAADSVASLVTQGGPMSPDEQVAFLREPWAADALVLRRADESGKVEGLVVGRLGEWMEVVRRLDAHAA
jgi:predicted HD phosphohydrolase